MKVNLDSYALKHITIIDPGFENPFFPKKNEKGALKLDNHIRKNQQCLISSPKISISSL